jgi:hypothetical protein
VDRDTRLPLLIPFSSSAPGDIEREVERHLKDGFRTFKIKVGKSAQDDARRVKLIQRAIAPAAHEQQRAGLEALRQRSAAMAQLIAGSCPSNAQLDEPMARFSAAKDRLDVMLFAVMSMSPVLQQLYDSLDDKQEAELGRTAPAAQQQPPPNASPPANAVFVNGTLAVPGSWWAS